MKDSKNQAIPTTALTRALRRAGATCALALAACGGPAPGAPDSGAPDSGGAAAPRQVIVPLSAEGHDRFFAVAYGRGGELYAAGSLADSTAATADARMVLARLTPEGALDPAFGQGGLAMKNVVAGGGGELARGVLVQSTGKIVVAGTVEHAGGDARDRDLALVRFNADGSVDGGFGEGGVAVLDLSEGQVAGEAYVADALWGLTSDGKDRILLHGARRRSGASDTDFAVVRLTADGARDPAFGEGGVFSLDLGNRSASPRGVTVLPDGGIVASGYYNDGGPVKPVIFKLTDGGQLDASFGRQGVFSQTVLMAVTEVYALALQGTSLVTAGYGRDEASESLDWISLRVSGAGVLDTSYGSGGAVRLDFGGFNDNARHLVSLPDGRLVLVGGARPSEGNVDAAVALLGKDGQRDTSFAAGGLRTFDLGGAADMLWQAALSPDGRTVAAVGVKGAGMAGQDDAALLLLPVAR